MGMGARSIKATSRKTGGIFMPIFRETREEKAMQRYTITRDTDRLAPRWLASRINYTTVKLLYRNRDGHTELKGVRIGNEMAGIGDTVCFDGRQLSIERR